MFKSRKGYLILAGLICVNGIMGCAEHSPSQYSTCGEMLTKQVLSADNDEFFPILDREANRPDGCWRPLMKRILDERRDIPLEHLKKAVKAFNNQRDKKYFHMAVYRYLAAIIKDRGKYRIEDKRLLESYTSRVIHSATASSDLHLVQARILCRRLDRNLYSKFFE